MASVVKKNENDNDDDASKRRRVIVADDVDNDDAATAMALDDDRNSSDSSNSSATDDPRLSRPLPPSSTPWTPPPLDAWRHDTPQTTGPALSFRVVARCGRARAAELTLPHGTALTPMFMPVGTQGSVKGLTSAQLRELDCGVVLANTYHLGHRPGGAALAAAGGLHSFMRYPRAMLTDSGGFQMVSLLQLASFSERGVTFRSPHDGTEMLLTPEHSMAIQNQIGADVMMALDDVVSSQENDAERVEAAMWRSVRWLDRCIAAHARPTEQNLFAIVQGGLDLRLRERCIDEMLRRNTPGYAIGGLSGGESKERFWRVVEFTAPRLPASKPRYLMGVGYAAELVVCVALGVDMFDCVFPSRTARFGTALSYEGNLNLRAAEFADDARPPDPTCACAVCARYSRAFFCEMTRRDATAGQLLTYHNIFFQLRLMRDARAAIVDDAYPAFVRSVFRRQQAPTPRWVVDALRAVDIELHDDNNNNNNNSGNNNNNNSDNDNGKRADDDKNNVDDIAEGSGKQTSRDNDGRTTTTTSSSNAR